MLQPSDEGHTGILSSWFVVSNWFQKGDVVMQKYSLDGCQWIICALILLPSIRLTVTLFLKTLFCSFWSSVTVV